MVTFHVSPVAGSCRVATGCLLDNLASSHLPFTPAIARYIYQVLSFENDPWAGLRRILAVACATTNKHWCVQRPVSVGRLSLWVNHLARHPNKSNSGHHNCSARAVFLCTAVKLQCCWHVMALRGSKDQVKLRRTHKTEFKSVEADHGIQDSRANHRQGQSGICVIIHFQRVWMLGERHW